MLEGGLETPSPINVIKAGFQELTEHKEPLFGMYNFRLLFLMLFLIAVGSLQSSGFLAKCCMGRSNK